MSFPDVIHDVIVNAITLILSRARQNDLVTTSLYDCSLKTDILNTVKSLLGWNAYLIGSRRPRERYIRKNTIIILLSFTYSREMKDVGCLTHETLLTQSQRVAFKTHH